MGAFTWQHFSAPGFLRRGRSRRGIVQRLRWRFRLQPAYRKHFLATYDPSMSYNAERVRRLTGLCLVPGTHRRTGSGTNHAAVNLLPGHGAYTSTRELGTRTPATATTEGCSSASELGAAWAAWRVLISLPLASSSTVRGSFTDATAAPGENGEPPERAGSGSDADH